MPRAPWRRHRATDIPRPAGRRWAGRLRRSGSLARQVLSVGRITRRHEAGGGVSATALVVPVADDDAHDPGAGRPRLAPLRRVRHPALGPLGPKLPVPVSPAVVAPPGTAPTGPLTIPLLPGERTVARRVRFALVNGCTISSLMLGMSAIFLAVNAEDVRWAALCLIACVVFDGLDGALARRLGVASPFGAQMDSLADMCSFGIAAPVVVYAWLAGSVPPGLVAPACGLVAVCAAIRLARFNVSPKDGRYFCGVPTTMAAAVLALWTLLGGEMPAWLRVTGIAVLALAMVTSFPYAKLARLLRLPPWLLVMPVVGALVDYHLTFGVVVLAYLGSGPLLWVRQRRIAEAV